MLLGATLLLVAAFEEAGSDYPWRSSFVITFILISGLMWFCFLAWERRVTLAQKEMEPVLPWRFIQSRIWVGMLLCDITTQVRECNFWLTTNRNAVFLGAPFFVPLFQLPQRYQFVNKVPPLSAGIRLLPFTSAAPIGSAISAWIAGKLKVPPLYLVICASGMQVIGFALLSTVPYSSDVTARQYGYEIIAGLGCGTNISLLVLMTPFSVAKRDKGMSGKIASAHMSCKAKYRPSCCPRFGRSIPHYGGCDRSCHSDDSAEQLREI